MLCGVSVWQLGLLARERLYLEESVMKNLIATIALLSILLAAVGLGGCDEGKPRGHDVDLIGSWNETNPAYFPHYRATFQQDGTVDFVGHGFWSTEGTSLFMIMTGESVATEYQYQQSGDRLTLTSLSGYQLNFVRSTVMADNGTFTNPPLPVVSLSTGQGGSSSSSGGSSSTTTPTAGSVWGTVYSNHGHTVQVDAATAAAALSTGSGYYLDLYDAAEDPGHATATHTHRLWVSAADIWDITHGLYFVGWSTYTTAAPYGSHDHMVTFN